MLHSNHALLQAMPEPALITRNGRVVCFNHAACSLFDDLTENAPVPAALCGYENGAGLVLAGGHSWHITASPLEDGTLYLLHAARLNGVSCAQLDGAARRLREQMGQLFLSVQLLQRSIGDAPDPEQTRRLADMNRTLCQMLRLVEQLDLLRDLEEGRAPFCPTPLDLAGLCREVCAGASGLLDMADVRLDFNSPVSSLLVPGDSALLERLLLELISNSARAAGKGGALTLSLAKRGNRAILSVSGSSGGDDGRPLSQLLAGDNSPDRIPSPGEGAGLGLVLVQHILCLHEGAVVMERRDGVCVTVALPLAKASSPLPVHSPTAGCFNGFSPALVGLSDLLPTQAFACLDEE
ncbi:MAG: HAMP domain-containing histidine kinase [Oscillospiraceae bacterium]|nr:HAMP domain-containing histidine kinase [Oscillospiraceae bacterium]